MKKYTVLAAAIAMVAFAGCNKEENNTLPVENGMVTFTMTGENYSSADKQNYNTIDQFIEFSYDEACWANGYYAPLTLLDPTTMEELTGSDATSRIARISVPEDYATLPFTILYPAAAFEESETVPFSQWNCPMNAEVEWIRENYEENSIIDVEANTPWPMAAVVNQGGYGSFQLRNCVAVLTPSVKFGNSFLQALASSNAGIAAGFVYDANTTVTINQIVLTSNVPLAGDAHVDFTGAYPVLVMDNSENASNTLTINPALMDMFTAYPTSASGENILGNVAVAPMHEGNTLKMDAYFTLHTVNGDYSCVYDGNTVTLTETPQMFSVLRSCRTTICLNLFGAGSASKVRFVE